jgi:hypothetical protein
VFEKIIGAKYGNGAFFLMMKQERVTTDYDFLKPFTIADSIQ